LASGAVRHLAAALAPPAAPSGRLDLVPYPARALRLVVLRPGPARAALPHRVPGGGGCPGAAPPAGPAAGGGGDLAAAPLRPPPPRSAAASGAGPGWRGALALPHPH